MNGQFAIAIWDKNERRLLLVRDRPGIRPLFYYCNGRKLVFGSEVKAIFAVPGIPRGFDPRGIDQIFTFWTVVGEATCFEGIRQVPPGCWVEFAEGRLKSGRYWDYPLPDGDLADENPGGETFYREAFLDQLSRSVRLRLRADVTVGSYLSGGIDSSAIAFLAQKEKGGNLKTYGIEFTDESLDESAYQLQMADHLGADHRRVRCDYSDIAEVFRSVVWHAEQPLFRTAPSPLYLLSRLVRDNGIKVVLTGEGSDEILWGYDLFKEAAILKFWAKDTGSRLRPQLFRRLYGHHPVYRNARYVNMLIELYRKTLTEIDDPFFSHMYRWQTNTKQKAFFSESFRNRVGTYDAIEHLRDLMPEGFRRFGDNGRAQYLECHLLLQGNLLSSQGDRMSMGHSVEGRYPFLDHELIEFCARLPARFKLRVLRDKYILRSTFRSKLPSTIATRPKHAYQAPEIHAFLDRGRLPEYERDAMNPEQVHEAGVFDPSAVSRLVGKAERLGSGPSGIRDNLAFVQILSTQIIHELFIKRPQQNNLVDHDYHVVTDA
jgi:asparagine synthase (glutamine-hydrolysing)